MRVLAIDPGLRKCGYAVLERQNLNLGAPYKCLSCGVLRNAPRVSQARALANIYEMVKNVRAEHDAEILALEAVIYAQNIRTALTMGSTRGVVLCAAARCGLECREYPPKSVKQAAVGFGSASKKQIMGMMQRLFNFASEPNADAADALAVGVACLNSLRFEEARARAK